MFYSSYRGRLNRVMSCILVTIGITALACGCAAKRNPQNTATGDATTHADAMHADATAHGVRLFAAPKQSGAELWSANCNRCHNAAPSSAFSAAEWDLIVHHMRLRANLTGQEARAIAEFMKSGS
jgi:nitrate/TMAO reductase-like tetraheme cytochrome c subunit